LFTQPVAPLQSPPSGRFPQPQLQHLRAGPGFAKVKIAVAQRVFSALLPLSAPGGFDRLLADTMAIYGCQSTSKGAIL
jgi:hypothetical protein